MVRALASSRYFEGARTTVAGAIPAISMPMHLSLDALCSVVAAEGSGKSAFVKTYRAGALDPFTFDGAAEAAVRAGVLGIAPRLLEVDAAQATMLFEPAPPDYKMALARDAQQPDARAAILRAKKAWHDQPPLSRDLSPFDLATDYAVRLEPQLGTAIPYKGSVPFASLKDWVDRIGAVLAAAGTDRGPVHGENTVSNILLGLDKTVLLVDFDRAANADPFYDLGALSLDLCRTDDERNGMIEMYCGRTSADVLARVKLYAIVDDFLWGCWALLAELNPAMKGPELLKYASNRFLRASHHLEVFQASQLLARV